MKNAYKCDADVHEDLRNGAHDARNLSWRDFSNDHGRHRYIAPHTYSLHKSRKHQRIEISDKEDDPSEDSDAIGPQYNFLNNQKKYPP